MRFLFRAQDNNMTNGDFAFFSYASGLSSRTYQPWDRYVDDPNELPYRQRAYYALKQVSLMPVETLIRLLVVCLLQYTRHLLALVIPSVISVPLKLIPAEQSAIWTFQSTIVTKAPAADFFQYLFCSLAVLDPRVGYTVDVLSLLISVLCHSD